MSHENLKDELRALICEIAEIDALPAAENAPPEVAKLRDGAYDIVFVNGDKLEYVEYVAGALRLLRHGGLLIVNDALWHNLVADEADEADETIIIREALDAVTASESYTQALLPVGNGLLVAVKD